MPDQLLPRLCRAGLSCLSILLLAACQTGAPAANTPATPVTEPAPPTMAATATSTPAAADIPTATAIPTDTPTPAPAGPAAPSGLVYAFVRDGALWLRDDDPAAQPHRAESCPTPGCEFLYLTWSPKGDQLVYVRRTQVADTTEWAVQLAGFTGPAVTLAAGVPALQPAGWSPDGSQVVYLTDTGRLLEQEASPPLAIFQVWTVPVANGAAAGPPAANCMSAKAATPMAAAPPLWPGQRMTSCFTASTIVAGRRAPVCPGPAAAMIFVMSTKG